jgi:hypothetical protein
MVSCHGGSPLPAGRLCIVTGKCTEPEVPNYVTPTPTGGTAATLVAVVPLTWEEWTLNTQLKSAYKRKLNEFKHCQEKAAGDILTHLSRPQRTYVINCHDDPAEMWATIRNDHIQQIPSMRFSAYNNLFSIVKGLEKTLPAVAPRIE